jgi:folate-binding protein YgfZ
MMSKLHDAQTLAGAIFEPSDNKITVPATFGNDIAAINAAKTGIALSDRSHWGRIQVSDSDRLRFLHNQSTNDFQSLKPGQGCDTVFVTSTARTIDLATAYVMEDSVLLLVSPHRRQQLIDWLDRYIFFADKVKLTDITEETAAFSLIGPNSDALLLQLGIGEIIGQPYGNHQQVAIGDLTFQVAVGSGLALPGYTFIIPADRAASLWSQLAAAGAVPLGENRWEQLRIEQGRPIPDRELTEDYNPLEAGLWQTISFEKGCYIGQETIARLNTYKGVKQHLWGVLLSAPVPPETAITVGEEKVGKLTSITTGDRGYLGLAYIRTKAGGVGLQVKVGEADGEIVELPFLSRPPQE